ncbi:MAG: hypothetical protein FJZ64_02530 [Chlamydiae bacterium]|nr:hypothetical protein [Chlamydiota bacterium]
MIGKIKFLIGTTAFFTLKSIWDDFFYSQQRITDTSSQKFYELQNSYQNVTGVLSLHRCPTLSQECVMFGVQQNPLVQIGTGAFNTASGLVSGVGSAVSAVGSFVQCIGTERGLVNKVTCISGVTPEAVSMIGKFILLGLIYCIIPSKQEKKEEI